MTTPLEFLREATKAVPAVKYALGIGGILATVAIVNSFKIDAKVAFIGTLVMLSLMGILVVFARMASLATTRLMLPALAFTWFVLLLFVAASSLLFTSVFIGRPLDLSCWLADPACVPKSSPSPPLTPVGVLQISAIPPAISDSCESKGAGWTYLGKSEIVGVRFCQRVGAGTEYLQGLTLSKAKSKADDMGKCRLDHGQEWSNVFYLELEKKWLCEQRRTVGRLRTESGVYFRTLAWSSNGDCPTHLVQFTVSIHGSKVCGAKQMMPEQ